VCICVLLSKNEDEPGNATKCYDDYPLQESNKNRYIFV